MYARFHGQFWMLGAELVAADRSEMDVVPQLEFRNNAIAYSEQSAMSIFHSLYRIHQARTAAQEALAKGTVADLSEVNAILELTRCPYLRAARTVDALCRLHGFSSGGPCNPDKPLRKMAASALAEGSAGLCPSVSEAQLSDLKYNAVPLEEIAIPWKN